MNLISAIFVVQCVNAQDMPPSINNTLSPICGPRVRRAWSALSPADKLLYRNAVNSAMVSGHHTLFMEVAADVPSFLGEERTNGMVLRRWRFLLGYETMIRSLEPRFSSLTIPFWDFFADYAKAPAGVCSSLEKCSQFLREFGSSNGSHTDTALCGVELPASGENGSCVGGVAGDQFPARTGLCLRLVSLRFGFALFSSNLLFGMKTSIHNALAGTMTTYAAAAAGPVYYSLQATVELIHELYYDCHVGRALTDLKRQTAMPNSSVYDTYVMEPIVRHDY